MDSAALRSKALKRGSAKSSLVFYRVVTRLLKLTLMPWVGLQISNEQVLDLPGPTVLAPVHRSQLDPALLALKSKRRIRALGKESLFRTFGASYVCAALGAIPVKRGASDRDALKAALELLNAGETMIVFPEGARASGDQVVEIFDGPIWLAARSGARIVPIGIAGTEQAMQNGEKKIKRSKVNIVVGDPIELDRKVRIGKPEREELATKLRQAMQVCQDEATQKRELRLSE